MDVLLVIFLFAATARGQQEQQMVNNAFDKLVEATTKRLLEAKMYWMEIPELSISGVKCSYVKVGNLTTLQRSGLVNLTIQENSITLKTSLELGEIKVDYNFCVVPGEELKAWIKANVQRHSIELEATVRCRGQGNEIAFKIDKLHMKLGNISFHTESYALEEIIKMDQTSYQCALLSSMNAKLKEFSSQPCRSMINQ